MKEFNLEEAKSGKAVCTRDGSPARIVCYDLKDPQYEILAAVDVDNGREIPLTYTSKGNFRSGDEEDIRDLMMVTEKHEGWGWMSSSANMFAFIYKTKEEALANKPKIKAFLVKLEWEE